MAAHTTNYRNTLITVAPDSAATEARSPDLGSATVAARQYQMITAAPYRWTSDDVLFTVWADRNDIAPQQRDTAREKFFAKGQPCMRSSPLAKSHGYGVHADDEGRLALVPVDSPRYLELTADDTVVKRPAMRSKRA